MSIEETLGLHRPKDERGSLAGEFRTVLVKEAVDMALEADLTFEQVMWLLMMGVEGNWYADSANPSFAKHDDDGVFTDLTNAIDGSSATSVTIVGLVAAADSIKVCAAAAFRGIRVDIGSTVQAVAATVTVTCSDGSAGWLACTLVNDGTLAGGASMAQDGVIEFTPHASWASEAIDGNTGFWIRLVWSANWTANVKINDLYTIPLACVWTYEPSLTSANTPQSTTIEYGDDVQEHESEYCVASGLEFSGAMDDVCKMKATIFGRNMAAGSFTGSLSDPSTLETAVANKTILSVDVIGGTVGTTPVSNSLIDFNIKIDGGFLPVKHGGSTLYFDAVSEQAKKVTTDLTLVFNTAVEAQRVLYKAGTQQLFQIKSTGSLIAGTTYKTFLVNFAGVYTKFKTHEEANGETIAKISIESQYDSTWAKLFQIVVTNTIAALE
uniref:Tail protein n=1 Tax=viral metagenome TaxID=1070528 RepID=A0A6M3L468_9ZZZZ